MFWNKRLSKSTDDAFELPYRFRRVRKSAAMRDMVRETHLRPEHLVLPIFVGIDFPKS